MRILLLTPYLSDDNIAISRNKTGFGYMVNDIASTFSRTGNDVAVYSHTFFSKNDVLIHSYKVLAKTWWRLLCEVNFSDIFLTVKSFIESGSGFIGRFKVALYFLSIGMLQNKIREFAPDVIHIHGIGFATIPFVLAAMREKKPFVITLHGINFLNRDILMSDKQVMFEKKMIHFLLHNKISVTVISSGIKRRVLNYFNIDKGDHFFVVNNGTDLCENSFPEKDESLNIRKQWGINPGDKIIICVGSITDNKNQIELVKAFFTLPENEKNNLTMILVGNDTISGKVQNLVDKYKLNEKVILTGKLKKEEVAYFYSIADFFATAVISEGFGIPMIEAFSYGIPVLCFDDIDGAYDLYDKHCMILVKERTTQDLANGISQMMSIQWDKKEIMNHSKNFSLSVMNEAYMKVFEQVDIVKLNERKFKDIFSL